MSDELSSGPERNGRVDINAASAETLRDQVLGIGQTLAERIVAFREEHGEFSSIDGLTEVSGIGPRLLQRIDTQITITTVDREEEATDVVPPGEDEQALAAAAELSDDEPLEAVPQEAPGSSDDAIAETDEGITSPLAALEAVALLQAAEALREDDGGDDASLSPPEPAVEAEAEVEAEEAPDPGTPMGEALEEPIEMEELSVPVDEVQIAPMEAPVASAAPEPTPAQIEPQVVVVRPKFLNNLLLVLLGGLLGVALTLGVAIIWSGTVDFAPRAEVDALSRNLSTMQSNQELAWERIDVLTLRGDELQRKVEGLESLYDRVAGAEEGLAGLEKGLDGLGGELAEARADMGTLSQDLGELRTGVEESLAQLDERVDASDEKLSTIDATMGKVQRSLDTTQRTLAETQKGLAETQEAVAGVEGRIVRFDSFFTALRDLLVDLEASPETPASVPEPEATAETK